MPMNQSLLAEFKQEAANTRKLLEKVPMEKADWKPHEKSMSLGHLARHIAEMNGWVKVSIEQDVLDFSKDAYKPQNPTTTKDLLAFFDRLHEEAITVLSNATDEKLMQSWTMRNGETVYFTMPKAAVVRTWCMNHVYHHRGQLTVYLRLLGVPLVGMYGPTADDEKM